MVKLTIANLELVWIACMECTRTGRFWSLNSAKLVQKFGGYKVEAWKTRNITRKRSPSWRTLSKR